MPDRDPGEIPPRRLLERAPSERYGARRPAASGRSEARGLAAAVLVGIGAAAIGVVVHLAFAVLLLATGALLVVAATLGFVVGASVRYGAGPRTRAGSRRGLGVALAVLMVAASLAINWGLSGMYLDTFDFLDQVYGLLVPLQVAAAAAGALAGAR